jgi:1-acyl-sn-glycerol-3-phosphate acyltransferase
MCLYPEGTRNKTDQPLKEFHSGAFRLALHTGKAIIPALIFNSRKVMPPNKTFYFHPHRMAMHFLPAVVPAKEDTVDTLKQKVFDIMWEYYTTHQA